MDHQHQITGRKRALDAGRDDNAASPHNERAQRRRTGEAGQDILPRLSSGADGPAAPASLLMALPAELLDRIIDLLAEEHLSCLLRASQPLYRAVQRVQQAVPASYIGGCLYVQAKEQRAQTAVNLRLRQLLDARVGVDRPGDALSAVPGRQPGSLSDYAHGLGQRYRHMAVFVDGPGLQHIAAGLNSSTGWGHLELISTAPGPGELAPFLELLKVGLRNAAPAQQRELSLFLGGTTSLPALNALASSLEPLLAQDAALKVTGMHLSSDMIEPLAAFLQANVDLQRLTLDLKDGRQSARGLALLENCSVQPASLTLRNLPSGMDYPRLSAILRAKLEIRTLCLHGKPLCSPAKGLVLAGQLSNPALRKLGLYRLRLDAANLAGLDTALAGQTGLHTLKFIDCAFPDGVAPLIAGLAANRGIVRLALTDCTIGEANDGKAQVAVLQALRHNPAIRQVKIDRLHSQAFWHAVAELRQHCPGMQFIPFDPERCGGRPAQQ